MIDKPERCMMCGELIPVLVERDFGDGRPAFVCCECMNEPLGHNPGREFPAESHDITYHGGLFNRGEW